MLTDKQLKRISEIDWIPNNFSGIVTQTKFEGVEDLVLEKKYLTLVNRNDPMEIICVRED